MLTASCHCGDVRIEVDGAPDYLNQCGCSVCRRYGVLWGYYEPGQARVVAEAGATAAYSWGPRELAFHRCRRCGCVSHWTITEPGAHRMGVNGRLFAPGDVAGVEVRQSAGPE